MAGAAMAEAARVADITAVAADTMAVMASTAAAVTAAVSTVVEETSTAVAAMVVAVFTVAVFTVAVVASTAEAVEAMVGAAMVGAVVAITTDPRPSNAQDRRADRFMRSAFVVWLACQRWPGWPATLSTQSRVLPFSASEMARWVMPRWPDQARNGRDRAWYSFSRQTMALTASAIRAVANSGRIIVRSAVISIMMMTEVIGARTTPVK